jgi:hypothetical protein
MGTPLTAATGAGVVVGGVLLGVTGGLAAPAIAALLAPLGFGILGAAAPAVLGTLFGLTGGGLAGWRVHERWRGVDEFAFVEVGAGTRPTREEVKDMQDPPKESIDDPDDAAALAEVQAARAEVLARLSEGTEGRLAPDEPGKTTRPTLTATIVVPGLLTVSCTEAIAAWRAACGGHLQPTDTDEPYSAAILPTGLQDGRDVYVLRFETKTMLSTGRDIESWVTSRLKNLAALEVVKQTILGAYYVAVALPLSVYQLSTMTLDNSWMHAQSMAVKAGRLLGEVLEQRVQGERPVVLVRAG